VWKRIRAVRIQSRAVQAVALLVIATPLLAFLHEALMLLAAWFVRGFFQIGPVRNAVGLLVTDPVHARVLLEVTEGINLLGLAVSGAPGHFLHLLFPALFLETAFVRPGAWVSAVVSQDSTALSMILTRALVECASIASGGLLVQWGMSGKDFLSLLKYGSARHLAAVAAGFLVMGQALWSLFGPTLLGTGTDMRDAGIGFVLSTVWQLNASEYAWLMQWFLPLLIPAVSTLLGVMLAWVLGKWLHRLPMRGDRELEPLPNRTSTVLNRIELLLTLVLVTALSSLSGGYLGLARTNVAAVALAQDIPPPAGLSAPSTSAQSTPPVGNGGPDGSYSTPRPTMPSAGAESAPNEVPQQRTLTTLPASLTPTVMGRCPNASGLATNASKLYTTSIQPKPALRLLVNGQARPLIGMNYNVNYTLLPPETRKARHERDFKILRDAGVNAIIGWGVYDEVTLQAAQEYGIGVIMPFDLDPKGAYDNAGYREAVRSKFLAFVNRFRAFPAVLAWNPGGDELLHRMDGDEHRTPDKLQMAADFLLELAQAAYQMDPVHVNIVKDARDWYLPYFEQTLSKLRTQPNQPDPGSYLVYSVNVYGTPANIAAALADAKRSMNGRLGLAMLVGEYAPFGLARKDRGAYYGQIWDIVLANSPNGGFAYVFGPDQPNPQAPNPYDPLRLLVNEFSLVNTDGTPVDNSLGVLTARWCRLYASASPPQ
jgi:hypothetical protein